MPTHSIQVEEQRPDDQPAQGIAQAGANGTGLGFPELGSKRRSQTQNIVQHFETHDGVPVEGSVPYVVAPSANATLAIHWIPIDLKSQRPILDHGPERINAGPSRTDGRLAPHLDDHRRRSAIRGDGVARPRNVPDRRPSHRESRRLASGLGGQRHQISIKSVGGGRSLDRLGLCGGAKRSGSIESKSWFESGRCARYTQKNRHSTRTTIISNCFGVGKRWRLRTY